MIRFLILRAFAWLVQREAAARFVSSPEPYLQASHALADEARAFIP